MRIIVDEDVTGLGIVTVEGLLAFEDNNLNFECQTIYLKRGKLLAGIEG